MMARKVMRALARIMIEKSRANHSESSVERLQVLSEGHSRRPVGKLIGVQEEPPNVWYAFGMRYLGNDAVHMVQTQTLIVTLGPKGACEDRSLLACNFDSIIGTIVIDQVHALASLGQRVPYGGCDDICFHPRSQD